MKLITRIIFLCLILKTILCYTERLYISDTKNIKLKDKHLMIKSPNNLVAKYEYEDDLDKHMNNTKEHISTIKGFSIKLYRKEFAPSTNLPKLLNNAFYQSSDILITYSKKNYDISDSKKHLCRYMMSLFDLDLVSCLNESGSFNFSRSSYIFDSHRIANHYTIENPQSLSFVNTKDTSNDMFWILDIINNEWDIDQVGNRQSFFINLKLDFENNKLYIEKITYLDDQNAAYMKINGQDIKVFQFNNKATYINLNRTLKKDGMHRELITEFTLEEQIEKYIKKNDCSFVLVETFSNSIFIDKYEMDEHERFGGPSYHIFNEIDLEKPSYFSTQNIVIIESNSNSISVPIHFRYQMPSEYKEYNEVSISTPRIFIQCEKEFFKNNIIDILFDTPGNEQSELIELIPSTFVEPLSVNIPTGRRKDQNIVYIMTNLLPILGSLFIIYIICRMSSRNVTLNSQKMD